MAKTKIAHEDILRAAVDMLKLPSKKVWADYDDKADVLYISFRKPQNASDSVMEDDLIYHYDGDELVGITVTNARSLTK